MTRIALTLFAATVIAPAALAQAPASASGGPLTKTMFEADLAAEFLRIDTNKDGNLSKSEIEASQRASAAAAATARNRAIFAQLDADKNGSLSAAEFAKIGPAAPPTDAGKVLAVLDANKDGIISRTEHRTGLSARFNQLDANKDGSVSEAEARAAAAVQK